MGEQEKPPTEKIAASDDVFGSMTYIPSPIILTSVERVITALRASESEKAEFRERLMDGFSTNLYHLNLLFGRKIHLQCSLVVSHPRLAGELFARFDSAFEEALEGVEQILAGIQASLEE